MNSEDPFGFAMEAGKVSKSQEEILRQQSLLGECLPSSDGEDHSQVAEERYFSPLLMVSVPDSLDDLSAENTHQDLFHTPPKKSAPELCPFAANRTFQADTEMTDVDDGGGRYCEGRPLVDLIKVSELGVPEMEMVTERTDTTETCLGGFSEMDFEKELQLKDGLGDLPHQNLIFPEGNTDSNANGNVNAVAYSKAKEVAGAGSVSPSLPTVRDGHKQLPKGRSNSKDGNVCGGSSSKREAIFVKEGASCVRQKVGTRSEVEELKDFGPTKRAEDEGTLETSENVTEKIERDAMEAEDDQILRKLPISLKTLDNEPRTKGLDSEMKESQQTVKTGKLNSNSKVNESAEVVSEENFVKWVENAVASDNQKLGSLPMPLLEWIENTKKSLNSEKKVTLGQELETTSLLDLLKRVQAYTGEDTDEDDDDLEDVSLLDILKNRGITFPRPRWWSDELYKRSKLKEFIN